MYGPNLPFGASLGKAWQNQKAFPRPGTMGVELMPGFVPNFTAPQKLLIRKKNEKKICFWVLKCCNIVHQSKIPRRRLKFIFKLIWLLSV
jgi:hypothetical protein